jgi:hypothetical protein
MPIFKIIESRPITNYWHWTVEAEDEEEALQKVMDGEVGEADQYYQEEEWDAESNYDVEEKTGQDL